jgi:UDP-N-acetylglucosamine--N-acetylmuramyl-(pentapeptide) pyrophosphoryl-undecaprenol N-acetylglucosamine transferase
VLVFGGSLGSTKLIDEVLRAKDAIARSTDLQVLLVTGRAADHRAIRAELTAAGATNVVVVPYIERMGEAFALADLIVSRAGATTLAEITSCGKASILVPWKEAADNHQWENARLLESERACTLADEDVIVRRGLVNLIEETIRDDRVLARLAANSRRVGMRQARALILGEIRATMRGAGA